MVIQVFGFLTVLTVIAGIITALRIKDGKSGPKKFIKLGIITVAASIVLMIVSFILQITFFIGIPILVIGLVYLLIGIRKGDQRQLE